jgi:hypothetical protein
MSDNMRFNCESGDGATLTVVPTEPNDGRAWVEIDGGEREGLFRLSRDDARALGALLIEIAGDATPATGEPSR